MTYNATILSHKLPDTVMSPQLATATSETRGNGESVDRDGAGNVVRVENKEKEKGERAQRAEETGGWNGVKDQGGTV